MSDRGLSLRERNEMLVALIEQIVDVLDGADHKTQKKLTKAALIALDLDE